MPLQASCCIGRSPACLQLSRPPAPARAGRARLKRAQPAAEPLPSGSVSLQWRWRAKGPCGGCSPGGGAADGPCNDAPHPERRGRTGSMCGPYGLVQWRGSGRTRRQRASPVLFQRRHLGQHGGSLPAGGGTCHGGRRHQQGCCGVGTGATASAGVPRQAASLQVSQAAARLVQLDLGDTPGCPHLLCSCSSACCAACDPPVVLCMSMRTPCSRLPSEPGMAIPGPGVAGE